MMGANQDRLMTNTFVFAQNGSTVTRRNISANDNVALAIAA